ncbi:MAG: hypothetical protein WA705_05100 [Candidatus Ozemobacteraceae bacterium]
MTRRLQPSATAVTNLEPDTTSLCLFRPISHDLALDLTDHLSSSDCFGGAVLSDRSLSESQTPQTLRPATNPAVNASLISADPRPLKRFVWTSPCK